MTLTQRIRLALIGFTMWAIGTAIFHQVGSLFLEQSALEYWLTVISTGVLCTAAFIGLMKAWRIEPRNWLQGAICLALPGMVSEIPILADFAVLMSNMHPETAGRYAALLFAGYASLIGFAWFTSTQTRVPLFSQE